MPFLVDSVRMAVTALGLGIHLVVHPILDVERGAEGEYVGCVDGAANEAWMLLEVDRSGPERRELLRRRLEEALDDVSVAVADWQPMRLHAVEIAHELGHGLSPTGSADAHRAAEFLRWLAADHFAFLGYREYEVVDQDGESAMHPVPGTGLGLLRDDRRDEHHPVRALSRR